MNDLTWCKWHPRMPSTHWDKSVTKPDWPVLQRLRADDKLNCYKTPWLCNLGNAYPPPEEEAAQEYESYCIRNGPSLEGRAVS
jgi:hypothetical protein